jgi:hypothetical protein
MVCTPAIATTAYFVAIVLLDLYNRDWARIPGHALFGVFATLLILFICQRASEMVAWILLAAPLGITFIAYFVSSWMAKPSTDLPVDPPEQTCHSCPCCHYRQCRCRRPCWRPKPVCPKCPDCPKPEPKPKPDNCIKDSLDE